MLKFFLRRLALVVPTFLGVTLLAFALIHLIPGDPVENLSGERGMEPARRARLLAEFGLDRPLHVQYLDYIGSVLRGDLGTSLTTHEPVLKEFLTLFPATVELAFFAMLFAVLLGIPAGILAALKRNSAADYAVMGASLTGYSMPIFWWALLLILFFSVQLGWTPVSGRIAVAFDFSMGSGFMIFDALRSGEPGALRSALSHLVLPTIALGTIPLAVIARMTRSSMLEVLHEDYVRTARAKGLPWLRVVLVHALRNALVPVVTVIGLQVGLLLSGAILTETIFSWPGVGNWLIHGVLARDYPVVQGGILLIATIVITVNLLVDTLYGVINPRIRHA
ncbi:Dipeptide transport system permease protein DppB [Burkholderiales bacterium]|nr:MAG: ABC transporter permease subunit [Burkholderiales bacterium]CAG1005518.1 Dipeptide transport system permease protein DppB [Burkholderiales bacterium]